MERQKQYGRRAWLGKAIHNTITRWQRYREGKERGPNTLFKDTPPKDPLLSGLTHSFLQCPNNAIYGSTKGFIILDLLNDWIHHRGTKSAHAGQTRWLLGDISDPSLCSGEQIWSPFCALCLYQGLLRPVQMFPLSSSLEDLKDLISDKLALASIHLPELGQSIQIWTKDFENLCFIWSVLNFQCGTITWFETNCSTIALAIIKNTSQHNQVSFAGVIRESHPFPSGAFS